VILLVIESMQNKQVKRLMSLQHKKSRDKNKQFIVEGEKVINEISSNYIDSYYFSESFLKKNDIRLYSKNKEVNILKDNIFDKISETTNSQGIMAICNKMYYNIEEVLGDKKPFILIGENISDPGNLGTLIRTADATGCTGILLTKGTVDIYNPKVIRASSGSIFNVKIIEELDINNIFEVLKTKNIRTFATHLKGDKYLYNTDFSCSCAILIGNEGKGITEIAAKKADCLIKIPIIGKAESLNVSVASGVILYEVVRQRIKL
jgi:RNA methyltransferase, TrmH family